MPDDDIAPEQCRAARAYLGWGQRELAEKAATRRLTILRFENRVWRTDPAIRLRIRRALEDGGARWEGNDLVLPWTRIAGP